MGEACADRSRKFRNYRSSDIKVSLAGIVSNLLLAVIFTLLALALVKLHMVAAGGRLSWDS